MKRFLHGHGAPPMPGRGAGFRCRAAGLAAVLVVLGCGKKGPPLPPLAHRPAPPGGFQVRQVGPAVQLSFRLPRINLDGTPAGELEVRLLRRPTRIEDATPERREWLGRNFRRGAGTIYSSRSGDMQRRPGDPDAVVLTDPEGVPTVPAGFLLAYRVELAGAAGPETPSPPAFLLPRDDLRPPTGLRWRDQDEGILLEWDPSGPGAGGPAGEGPARRYNLYRASGSEPFPDRPLNPEPLEESSFLDRQRPPEGGTQRYRVREWIPDRFARVESGDSGEVRVSTPRFERPQPPTDLTVAVTGELIRLIWIPPAGEPPGGFRVFRRTGEEGDYQFLGEFPPSEVSFTDRTARPGVVYWYRVTSFSARHPERESDPAGPVSGTVSPQVGGPGEKE